MECILCGGGKTAIFYQEPSSAKIYFKCADCDLGFLDPAHHLSPDQEYARYLCHENHPGDARYLQFLRPLTDLIEQSGAREVLDFGCGAGAPLKHVLEPRGYKVALFDPFFYPDPTSLEGRYDYIAASEVVEHLRSPAQEFKRLRDLLAPRGRLGIMTEQRPPDEAFGDWYYRRDPTHVAFYSAETLAWIGRHHGFDRLQIHSPRLAEWTSP